VKAVTIAKRITVALMSFDYGQKSQIDVERIALMKWNPNGTETNLGGLCKRVVTKRIVEELKRAGIE